MAKVPAMLTMLGSPRQCCDGWTRRETLRVGALSFLGGCFNLPSLLAAEASGLPHARPGRAKSVILLYLLGGAATQDMYDLKPDGPSGTKSEFKPIATNVPGIQICEHLPKLARWMQRTALIRSVNHQAGCHNCLPSYCGLETPMPDQHPRESDPPSMGSVCAFLDKHRGRDDLPAYFYLPNYLGWGQAFRRAGPYGGFLGKRYDAFTTECEPYTDPGLKPTPGKPAVVRGLPLLPNSVLPAEMTIDRLHGRHSLMKQIDVAQRRLESSGTIERYGETHQQAFSLLTASKIKQAFDLSREPTKLVDAYGRTLFGNCTLIARRLVERGVRFVNVTFDLYWDRLQIDYDAWDTHTNNFAILKENKLPVLDQVFSTLMEDLNSRGLLDETLVVVTSEMGRTPNINARSGRDHWTHCYGSLLAGAGIKGGSVVGASDSRAAYVKDRPVSTGEICATIYEILGINPEMPILDRAGRPVPIALGAQPIAELLA